MGSFGICSPLSTSQISAVSQIRVINFSLTSDFWICAQFFVCWDFRPMVWLTLGLLEFTGLLCSKQNPFIHMIFLGLFTFTAADLPGSVILNWLISWFLLLNVYLELIPSSLFPSAAFLLTPEYHMETYHLSLLSLSLSLSLYERCLSFFRTAPSGTVIKSYYFAIFLLLFEYYEDGILDSSTTKKIAFIL